MSEIVSLINQTFEELDEYDSVARSSLWQWILQDVNGSCTILAHLINDNTLNIKEINSIILLFMHFYSSKTEIIECFTPELINTLYSILMNKIVAIEEDISTRHFSSQLVAVIMIELYSENPELFNNLIIYLFNSIIQCQDINILIYLYKIIVLIGSENQLNEHYDIIFGQILVWIRKDFIQNELVQVIIELIQIISDQICEKNEDDIKEVFEFLLKYSLDEMTSSYALKCIYPFYINAPFTVVKYDEVVWEMLVQVLQNGSAQAQICACEIVSIISELPFVEKMANSHQQQLDYLMKIYQHIFPSLISVLNQSPAEIDAPDEYTPYIAVKSTFSIILDKIVEYFSFQAFPLLEQNMVLDEQSTPIQKYVSLLFLDSFFFNHAFPDENEKQLIFLKVFSLCEDVIPRIRHYAFKICYSYLDQIEEDLTQNLIQLSNHIEDELPIACYVFRILSKIAFYQEDPTEIFAFILQHWEYLRPVLKSKNKKEYEAIINEGPDILCDYFPTLVNMYQNTLSVQESVWLNNEISRFITLFVARFNAKINLNEIYNLLIAVVHSGSCFTYRAISTIGCIANFLSDDIKTSAINEVLDIALNYLSVDSSGFRSATLCIYYLAKEKNIIREKATSLLAFYSQFLKSYNDLTKSMFIIIIHCISSLMPIADFAALEYLPLIQNIWPFTDVELYFIPNLKYYNSISQLLINYGPFLRKELGNNYEMSINLILNLLHHFSTLEDLDNQLSKSCVYLILQASFSYSKEYMLQFLNENTSHRDFFQRLQIYLSFDEDFKTYLYEIQANLGLSNLLNDD